MPAPTIQTPSTAAPTEDLRWLHSRSREIRGQDASVVVGVDGSASGEAAARAAISVASRLPAPIVFVYVRRGPSSLLGEPYYQRRLDAEILAGKRALDDALSMAERAGVEASSEQLAGRPARRLVEFARLRGARMVVMGSRRRRFGTSVSRRVILDADRPVMVASAAVPVAS